MVVEAEAKVEAESESSLESKRSCMDFYLLVPSGHSSKASRQQELDV